MKLVALKASSVRGIAKGWQPLPIGPKGLIVYGPNGVGKSSIIDAIEFALTGQSTLFPQSGQGYSWDNAAPHAQHGAPQIALSFNDAGTERDLNAGSAVPTAFSQAGKNWLAAATKSQFVLRRHMLLRFISGQPRNRYDLLEPFFNMDAFNRIETALQSQVTDHNTKKARADASIQNIETQLKTLFAAPPTATLSEPTLYALLNATLDKLALAHCSDQATLTARKSEVAQHLGGKGKTERIGALQALKTLTQKLSSPHTLKPLLENFLSALNTYEAEVSHRTQEVMTEFLVRGLGIIDGQALNDCPLCEQSIKDRSALVDRLKQRIAADEKITAAKNEANKARTQLTRVLREQREPLNRFIVDWKATIGSALSKAYADALDLLNQLAPLADDPSTTHAQLAHYPALIGAAALDHSAVLKSIDDQMIAEGAGERHTLLTRADSMIDALSKGWEQHKQLSATRLSLSAHIRTLERLHSYAVAARKETVQAIVDEVSTTAKSYYETIHPDEQIAPSKLPIRQAADASIDIKATFYGEEIHPMRYFSESHLDTLGLCYFLALCRRQTTATPDFRVLILDDVMHSVDAAHRNRVAQLLAAHFGDFQIIITTHDEPFYARLRQHLGNNGYAYTVLSDWTIADGPILGNAKTDLDKILDPAVRQTMSQGDLAAAGGRLFEWLLKQLTESLEIAVLARFNRKHTLDNLWKPACSKMTSHKGFVAVHPKLASGLDENVWVRNECGGHDNSDTASGPSLPEVQEFAALLADLYNATWCAGCRRFIAKQSDDGWRCACATLNYPKNPPTTATATAAKSAAAQPIN